MLKIGVAQTQNSIEIEENFTSIASFLKCFEKTDVQLVVFPECALSGFSAKIKECSIDRLHPHLESVRHWSLRTGIQVVLPTAIFEQGQVYNSGFWIHGNEIRRFQKLGLTESEERFFSVAPDNRQKVFEVNGYKCALLICREAQLPAATYFAPGEADLVLWPGYWGWTAQSIWGPLSEENRPNSVFENMSLWKTPIIQANFARNNLGDTRSTGPEGLSVVVDESNILQYRAPQKQESAFVVTLDRLEGRCVLKACEPLSQTLNS
jgi:predicted amidohydrolase